MSNLTQSYFLLCAFCSLSAPFNYGQAVTRLQSSQLWLKLCGNLLFGSFESLLRLCMFGVYATIREDLVEWMDQEIEKLRFASRSHAIEYALAKLKEGKEHKG